MTKLRGAGSFEQATLDILRTLGVRDAAQIANLSPKTMRDYSDPDRAGRPRLAEAVKLDIACFKQAGRAPFFEAYQLNLAAAIQALEQPSDNSEAGKSDNLQPQKPRTDH
jgi:hypothetical protein